MKSQLTARRASRNLTYTLAICMCLLFALSTLGLAGCAMPADDSNDGQASSGTETPVGGEVVTGTITSIEGSELLVEASEDGNDYLQGPVRVDVSEIESSITESLEVGDTVTVEFSGAVGTSDPPFISATTLEVTK